jgi:hypothetical protein
MQNTLSPDLNSLTVPSAGNSARLAIFMSGIAALAQPRY